ncbi:MAG: SGNH/GDSL hydrolase family protein [Planctomycetota bacterium]
MALLVLALLAELAVRVLLTFEPWSRPFLTGPVGVIYPELHEVPASQPDQLRLLLLGGSVLDPDWSTVAVDLEQRLPAALGRAPDSVRVVNLARAGHTTLDSFSKYRLLAGEHFDLVVLYHAINDLRANNVPPELFRADYSHYLWYRVQAGLLPPLDALDAQPLPSPFVLPLAARYAALAAGHALGWLEFLAPGEPQAAWLAHGAELKTVATFRANLQRLARLAEQRGERVLMLGFASYVAPGYTRQAFGARQLDYAGAHGSAIELWGRPEHVVAGLAAHNAIIAEVAPRYFDMRPLAELRGSAFRDICHLSLPGTSAFVERLLPELVAALSEPSAPSAPAEPAPPRSEATTPK